MAIHFWVVLAVLLASLHFPLAQPVPLLMRTVGGATSARLIVRAPAVASEPFQGTTVTTTTLKAIPSPSVLTETVSLEATVMGALGAGMPTGSINLYGDGALVGVEQLYLDNWVRLELPTLTPGTHIFTATYSGDSVFAPSTSARLTHIVRRSGVRLGLYSEDAFQVTFSFDVIPELGSPPPDGSVTVSDGTSSCTAAVSMHRCTIMFPTAGPRRLTATYTGSAILESNVSAPLDYTVQRYPVNIRTELTPSWIDAGQPLTITFAVVPFSVTPWWPSGAVTVRVGDSAPVCSVPNTAGTCTFIPPGRFPITIDYSGDSYFAPSSISLSTPVRLGTGIFIHATPDPVQASQVMTLTAGLTSNGIACAVYCAPTGQVYYYDNGNYLARAGIHPHVGAVFPITVTLTTLGSHSITGSYSGDTHYAPSTSAPLRIQVVPLSLYFPLIVTR